MGGLAIAVSAGAGARAELLHYANGSGKPLTESVPCMSNVKDSAVETAANVPGGAVVILGGEVPVKGGSPTRPPSTRRTSLRTAGIFGRAGNGRG